MAVRDYQAETVAPYLKQALEEAGIDPTGANDPAFVAQGLGPLHAAFGHVRQAQRNIEPAQRVRILGDPIDRELTRLKVAVRALELLRDDARGVLTPEAAKPAPAEKVAAGSQYRAAPDHFGTEADSASAGGGAA